MAEKGVEEQVLAMERLHKKRCCLLVELKRKKVVDIHHKYNNNSKCLNYNYSI